MNSPKLMKLSLLLTLCLGFMSAKVSVWWRLTDSESFVETKMLFFIGRSQWFFKVIKICSHFSSCFNRNVIVSLNHGDIQLQFSWVLIWDVMLGLQKVMFVGRLNRLCCLNWFGGLATVIRTSFVLSCPLCVSTCFQCWTSQLAPETFITGASTCFSLIWLLLYRLQLIWALRYASIQWISF